MFAALEAHERTGDGFFGCPGQGRVGEGGRLSEHGRPDQFARCGHDLLLLLLGELEPRR